MVLSIVGLTASQRNVVAVDETVNVNIASNNGGVSEYRSGYTQAVRDGRAYTAATSAVRIPQNKYLNVAFLNPSGSGKNCLFVARKLGGSRESGSRPFVYGFILSPEAMSNSIQRAGNNRLTGGAQSAMTVWQQVGDKRLDSNPTTAAPSEGFLPNGGTLLNVDDEAGDATRVVPPGFSFGFYIFGDSAAKNADRARVVMTWYEESAT